MTIDLSPNKAVNKKDLQKQKRVIGKRTQIMQAAVQVFAKKGYPQGTVADIAREANVSYGLIYSYFGNKDDILFSLFHERWQMLIDYIERVRKEEISADAKLQKIGNFIIRSYEREPDLIKVLILHIVPHSPFFEKNREAVMLTFRLLQCIIEEGQEKNVFNRSLNPQIAAHGFYGAIIQILVGWIKGLFPDFRPNVVEACQFIQNLVESWSVKPLNPKSPMPTEILSH